MIEKHRAYMRNPDHIAIGCWREYLFVGPDGRAPGMAVSSAAAWSVFMRNLMEPMLGSSLRMWQSRLTEGDWRVLERMLDSELLPRIS